MFKSLCVVSVSLVGPRKPTAYEAMHILSRLYFTIDWSVQTIVMEEYKNLKLFCFILFNGFLLFSGNAIVRRQPIHSSSSRCSQSREMENQRW